MAVKCMCPYLFYTDSSLIYVIDISGDVDVCIVSCIVSIPE